MKVKGTVFTGVSRGRQMIDMYKSRIKGLIGYEPLSGTLDIKLDREIDMIPYSTKRLDHVLLNGAVVVDLYLAPAILSVPEKGKEDVWVTRQGNSPYRKDVLEIISRESLREKFRLNDGDEVEIEFITEPEKKGRMESFLTRFHEGRTSTLD
ncbi:MAG: DUF120 domain-containing protein [Candidatus Aenigmarchaeota archaeon]|nr:DUF120 domain-containing protein [Candidatus Aenigmarchaeota archaeon]